MKPGLSGIGSIVFRNEEVFIQNINDKESFYKNVIMPYKGKLESWFVENAGISSYFKIIFVTVLIILRPSTLIWKKMYGGKNDSKWFLHYHDYIVVYAKNKENWYPNLLPRTEKQNDRYKNPDNDPRGVWTSADFTAVGLTASCIYEIKMPNGNKIMPPEGKRWMSNFDTYISLLNDNRLWFGADGGNVPRVKRFLSEVKDGVSQSTFLDFSEVGHSDEANKELKDLMQGVFFDYPKPKRLLKRLVHLGTNDADEIILDFFSGSATTAHAVMQLNAEDGGNRKFIMVQFPEICDEKSEAAKAGYANICEIGKERIRRAGEKIKAEIEKSNAQLKIGEEPKQVPDIGFRVFRVADTNIRWTHEAIVGEQLEYDENMLSDKDRLDFMPGYTDIDVVYEVLLRQRDIPLSANIEKLSIGNRTYIFADAYVVCLDDTVTVELVEALAAVEPTPIKYVFRDSAFDDNISLKDETIRRLEAYIARNSGEQKKAYTVEFI